MELSVVRLLVASRLETLLERLSRGRMAGRQAQMTPTYCSTVVQVMSESWPAGRGVGWLAIFLMGGSKGMVTGYVFVGGWLVDDDYHSNDGDCADTSPGVS